jgi:hypothetical protein
MMNPITFVANMLFVCAMMTFLPSVAFAIANATSGAGGLGIWPILRSK